MSSGWPDMWVEAHRRGHSYKTNLEDISLRIFKSMGTDEITRVQGSKEREDSLAPTPRTPAIW